MRKMGGRLRKNSAEEFSEDSARQELRDSLCVVASFQFYQQRGRPAEDARKMCGRLLFTKGEWSIHLVKIELNRMRSYNSKCYYSGKCTDRLLLAKVS